VDKERGIQIIPVADALSIVVGKYTQVTERESLVNEEDKPVKDICNPFEFIFASDVSITTFASIFICNSPLVVIAIDPLQLSEPNYQYLH